MLFKTDLMLFKTKHLSYVTHIRARTFLNMFTKKDTTIDKNVKNPRHAL